MKKHLFAGILLALVVISIPAQANRISKITTISVKTDTAVCHECVKDYCYNENQECTRSYSCSALIKCWNGCVSSNSPACYNNCNIQHNSYTLGKAFAYNKCVGNYCKEECSK